MALLKTLPSDIHRVDAHYHRIDDFGFSKSGRSARIETHSFIDEAAKDAFENDTADGQCVIMRRSWSVQGEDFDAMYAANTNGNREYLFELMYDFIQNNRSAESRSVDANGDPVSDFADAVSDHKDIA